MSYTLNRNQTPTWARTMDELGRCFELWGVRRWSAEPNVPLSRVNGAQYGAHEAAVTVRYTKDDREIVLTHESQEWPGGNLRALFLSIDAMRLLDVRGLGDVAKSAYLQLAAPATVRDPWEVLGLRPGASPDLVNAVWRELAKTAHPDHGGSNEKMAELNAARAAALGEAAPVEA